MGESYMTVEFLIVRGESATWGETGPVDVPEGFEPFAIRWPVTGNQPVDTSGPWPFEVTCWRRLRA